MRGTRALTSDGRRQMVARAADRAGGGGNVFRFNCQPIVEAGQALLVDDGYQLDDTFWLVPTPGHSSTL
jgi:hypothetical protein